MRTCVHSNIKIVLAVGHTNHIAGDLDNTRRIESVLGVVVIIPTGNHELGWMVDKQWTTATQEDTTAESTQCGRIVALLISTVREAPMLRRPTMMCWIRQHVDVIDPAVNRSGQRDHTVEAVACGCGENRLEVLANESVGNQTGILPGAHKRASSGF